MKGLGSKLGLLITRIRASASQSIDNPNPHSCKKFDLFIFYLKGTSAYAGPHYHKLYGRVIRVWNNRRGQPKRSAMQKPRSGRSPALIRFASPSGKYAVLSPSKTYKSFWLCKIYGSWSKYKETCVLIMHLG